MVGKSNPSKVHVTQEQLRLARLMQETSLAEKDKAKYQAALKQVMDLTKCNQDIAVIALYDHGNNVEEAVMAVLEQGNQPDVWNENKSRKTKKPEEKKEKTDKKEDRFNDRTRDTGGHRGRDLASAHGQVGERGRGRQEHNDDRQARTNLENTSRSANHQRVVMEPAIISANSTSQMVTSISHAQPEEGRTWSSIVKSLPPKVELNESLVDAKTNVLNSLADDEFSADFKGLTFTNKQFQDHQISKEQLNSLIANGKAAQQASNEVISNSSSPMEIENMPSTTIVASPQVDHDKTLCSLTNMLKKDIGLPISISTTTGSTEHCGLKIAQSVSEDSLLENKESPVVFLDQNFRSDWHEERQESDNNFSFGEIQGTVEFVDERENEMTGILSRDDVAISFDPYYHQLNSMSSGIASGCTTSAVPTPSPENFGFTSLGTVVDIPPTNFPLAVNEEIKPNFVQAQMSKFTLVSGPSIDFYEQPSIQGYVTTGINSSQSSEIVGASVLDMNNLAPPGLSNLVSQTSQLSCLQQQQQQQQANMLQQQQLMALFCQNGYPYFQSSGMDSQQAAEMINSNVSNVSNFVPPGFQNRNTQSVQVPMLQPQYQPAQNVQMTKMLQGYPYYPLDNKQYARVTPAQAMAFSNFVPQQMSNFANPGHQQYGSGIASEQMTRKQHIPATAYSAIPSKTATNSLFAQNPSQHQEYNNQNAQMSTFPNQNYNN